VGWGGAKGEGWGVGGTNGVVVVCKG
jgi:hypothetical protein